MSALPKGWAEVELGEVFRGNRRSSVVPAKEPHRRFELYSVPSFETGAPERLYGSEIGSSKQEVAPGSVLLCRINPRINRVWVVGEAGSDPQIASTEWVSLPRVAGVTPRFAMQALRTPQVRRHLTSSVSGVGGSLMRVRMDALWRTKIRLAPLPEQHRIVAKIESLFARLDEGVAALKRAEANLERYRASVLKAAVEGRLTQQWRTENPPEETGEELLARIQSPPRPARYRTRFKGLIVGHPALSVGATGSSLPDAWSWTRLIDVARLESGHTPSRRRPDWWDGDVPWIGIKDARAHHGGTIFETLQMTNEAGLANSAARLLPSGTVCLSRTASVGYVVMLGRPMATSQDFVNWICTEALDPRWLQIVFLADPTALRRFGKGSTHTTVYFPEVLSLHVAVPPLAEQRAIVAEVDARLSEAAEHEDLVRDALQRSSILRQSILKRAFEGRLVSQDPTDEPASVLLDRIRAERATERNRKKHRPAKPRSRQRSRVP